MASVRLNVSLPEETFKALVDHVEPRQRSRFINTAVRRLLQEEQAEKLASEYRAASKEIRTMNEALQGTIHDGLD